MSKRPRTANAVMSRLRRPAGRLRDMPIWTKLALIMFVPTLATIAVGTNGLIDHINEAKAAERARVFAAMSQASGDLADHLQNERSAAMWFQSTPAEAAARNEILQTYNNEHPLVDQARGPYAQQKNALSDVPEKNGILLLRLDRNLADLPSLRSQVANNAKSRDVVNRDYSEMITDLLNVRDASAQLAVDAGLSDQMRTAAAVARGKEAVAQMRALGHQAIATNQLSLQVRRQMLSTAAGLDQAESTMDSVGTEAEQQLYKTTVVGPTKVGAGNYIGFLLERREENLDNKSFDAKQWDTALTGYGQLFRTVETRLDEGILKRATAVRGDVQQRVFLESSGLLATLLLAILFAWMVARSMARSLRELRQGALAVAQFGLPHAVSRLRDPSLSSSMTPTQIADQIAEPLPVRGRDEFGQVTEAFNAVHLEAVRTAAEQAALRSSVSTMFVNLARRSQILVDRLIGHLDRLERGEEDPDRLAELFQLDHLATRMRRNDENLLVLAGADSTRIQREPAALIDVLRAAQSEVEHYTRIEFGNVERDIEVSAHAVNDMVHLVAELFDNATAFSPPDSQVMVDARYEGDRTILYVEDRGIGISPDQIHDLNERLANPPLVDVAVSRMMGLVVVARLASRHGVRVELRPSDGDRGTVAEVDLPSAVLVPRALAGRLQAGGATAFDSGPQQSDHRLPFAAPLALEGGPAGGRGTPANAGYPAGRPFDPNPPMMSGGMLGAGSGGGRSVPAWSDLTGAPHANGTNGHGDSHGTNGANGGPGPRGREGLAADPFRPHDEGLPRRRSGESYPSDGGNGSFGPGGGAIPRQLPPYPEQPGRNGFAVPLSDPPGAPPTRPRPISSPPVPSSPAGAGGFTAPSGQFPVVPASAPPVSAPPSWPPVPGEREASAAPIVPESLAAALDMTAEIPRLRPDTPTVGATGDRRPEPTAAAQSEAQRAADHAAAAHEAATAQAAAAQATAAAQIAAAQSAHQRSAIGNSARFADETMELPIFRELESAWFQTARPGEPGDKEPVGVGATAAAADAPPATPPPDDETSAQVVTVQRFSTGEPTRPLSVPQQTPSPEAAADRTADISLPNSDALAARQPAAVIAANGAISNGSAGGRTNGTRTNGTDADPALGNGAAPSGWRTAADDGWQAARAASELPIDTTTMAGLPRRTPMAQLVPGGVERAGASVQRRTPEAVRGLLSAYHRGVQRGRTKDHPTSPEETSDGQQSSQAGKEHEG